MFLFKFTSFEKALDILQNHRLPISNPKYFNDPFDSRIAVDDNDQDAIKLYKSWPPCTIPIGARGCYGNPYKEELNRYNRLIEDAVSGADIREIENWRIACFSRQTDWVKYIMMWSLYADSHKGVMFEFSPEFEEYIKKSYELSDVQYKNERIMITYQDSLNSSQISAKRKEALITKSKAWEYEKETRLIIPANMFSKDNRIDLYCQKINESYRDFLKIDCKWISKVVCGAMMPDNKFVTIREEAQKMSIKCMRLRLCAVKYELHDFDQMGCKY